MLTTKNWHAWCAPSLVGLLAIAVLGGCTPSGPRALLDGEHLLREGKYPQAITRLQKATRLLPANAQAWNHLGLAYHKAGQLDKALQSYEQARRCDMNLTPVRFNIGCLLLEQGNPQSAAAELATYTLLERDSVDGWLKLGTAQLRTRQWDSAEHSFQNALRLRAELPEAWNGLGIVQTQRKHPKEAMVCFDNALQKQPNYPPALLNAAVLNQQYLNNRTLALQQYQEYLQAQAGSRESVPVQETMRRLQAELAPPPARRELTNVVIMPATTSNAPPHSHPVTNLAMLRTNSNPATPQASNPPPSTLRTKAPAPILAAPEAPGAAEKIAAETIRRIEMAPRSETPARSTTLARETVAPNLAANPAPATALAPTNSPPPPVTQVAIVQLPEEAPPKPAQDSTAVPVPINQSAAVASADPMDQARALLSQKVKEQAAAEPTTPKRRMRDRLNPSSWFRGKKSAATNSSPVESIPGITTSAPPVERIASKSSPPSPVTVAPEPAPGRRYAYRSPAKPAAGNRAKADPIFAQAVQAHRDGRLKEAVESYRKAAKLDPSFFEAHYNLGLAEYELKNVPQSLSAYETALSINPTSINARYNFALALQQGSYFQDAASELEKVLEENPNETRAHFTLASLYADKLGQPSLARPHYRKVLELDPQHPQAPAIRYWLASNL